MKRFLFILPIISGIALSNPIKIKFSLEKNQILKYKTDVTTIMGSQFQVSSFTDGPPISEHTINELRDTLESRLFNLIDRSPRRVTINSIYSYIDSNSNGDTKINVQNIVDAFGKDIYQSTKTLYRSNGNVVTDKPTSLRLNSIWLSDPNTPDDIRYMVDQASRLVIKANLSSDNLLSAVYKNDWQPHTSYINDNNVDKSYYLPLKFISGGHYKHKVSYIGLDNGNYRFAETMDFDEMILDVFPKVTVNSITKILIPKHTIHGALLINSRGQIVKRFINSSYPAKIVYTTRINKSNLQLEIKATALESLKTELIK